MEKTESLIATEQSFEVINADTFSYFVSEHFVSMF